jgi:ankyrin repeat protein
MLTQGESGDSQMLKQITPLLGPSSLLLKDTSGRHAIYYACRGGHQDCCNILYNEVVLNMKNVSNINRYKLLFAIITNQPVSTVIDLLGDNKNYLNAELSYAAFELTYFAVKLLGQKAVTANAQVGNNTPLIVSIQEGHIKIVDALLRAGADINQGGILSLSPLTCSIVSNQTRITRRLLMDKPNVADDTGCMFAAVMAGDCDLIRELSRRGGDVNGVAGGIPIIFYPIRQKNIVMVALLLELDANVDNISYHSERLLGAFNIDIAFLILKAQVKKYINQTSEEKSPDQLKVACELQRILNGVGSISNIMKIISVKRDMIEADPGLLRLSIDYIKLLVIKSTRTSSENMAILDFIAIYDSTFLNSKLLSIAGMSISLIKRAAGNGYTSILNEFYDMPTMSSYMKNPRMTQNLLSTACARNNFNVVDILLARGGDLNTKDVAGSSIIHEVCRLNRIDILNQLIERNVQISLGDKDGYTPLHLACSKGHVEVARILVANGANLSATNIAGDTPLDIVVRNGDQLIIDMLAIPAQPKEPRI